MDETVNSPKYNKYFKVVVAACFLLAAVCVGVAVIIIIDFVKFISSPKLDGGSIFYIIYLIGGVVRFGLYIVYPLGIIIVGLFSVGFIWSGIALIKQPDEPKTKTAITLSFVGSLVICLASFYPFVISVCRIIAHGYQEQYYWGFWLGMVAFVFSTLGLVFSIIIAKKCRLFLNTNRC